MKYESIFKGDSSTKNLVQKPAQSNQVVSKELTSIESIVNTFFTLYVKAQYFHWQTSSFSKHKMLGEIVDSIDELKDKVVEYLLGVQAPKKLSSSPKIDNITEYSDNNVAIYLEEGFQFTVSLIKYGKENNLEELVNLASDLQEVYAKSKYLNTLS